MDEPVHTGRPSRCHQAARDRLIQRRNADQRRTTDRAGDQAVREPLTDDRGDLEYLPRHRAQPVEASPDGLPYRRRDWPVARSAGRRPLAPELGERPLAGLSAGQPDGRRPDSASRRGEQCLEPRGWTGLAGGERPQDVQPRPEGNRR